MAGSSVSILSSSSDMSVHERASLSIFHFSWRTLHAERSSNQQMIPHNYSPATVLMLLYSCQSTWSFALQSSVCEGEKKGIIYPMVINLQLSSSWNLTYCRWVALNIKFSSAHIAIRNSVVVRWKNLYLAENFYNILKSSGERRRVGTTEKLI